MNSKLVSSSILVALSAFTHTASADSSVIHQQIKDAVAQWSTQYHPRRLDVEQCLTDTDALFTANPALTVAYDGVAAELQTLQSDICGSISFQCELNEDDLASAAGLRDACVEAGGKIHEFDMTVSCEIGVNGQSGVIPAFTFDYKNRDECLAADCDPDAVAEALGRTADQALQDIQNIDGFPSTLALNCDTQYFPKQPVGEDGDVAVDPDRDNPSPDLSSPDLSSAGSITQSVSFLAGVAMLASVIITV